MLELRQVFQGFEKCPFIERYKFQNTQNIMVNKAIRSQIQQNCEHNKI